jgi:hypothetical protein
MDAKTLREKAAEHRRHAENAQDEAVKHSHEFLARVLEEEAEALEKRN